jgi:hypothetical protein
VFGPIDPLEIHTPTGGTTQQARRDYVYTPGVGFVREHDSTQFGPRDNTFQFNGGTSDEFRYNNSESQSPNEDTTVTIGESVSGSESWGWSEGVEAGDENLGASAEVNAGAEVNGTASIGFDRNSVDASVSGEVFVGVSAEAEAHASAGPVNGSVAAEARAGAGAEANAGLTIDAQNGLSGEFGAGAFAGAEVNLEATAGLGDSVEATGGVDLKAGIGAEASGEVDFGFDRVGVDLEIGATLGIGLDVSVDVGISPSGIIDDAGDLFNGFKGLFGN